MAIAPVNKFLSVMVPVAPGEQKLYEVPTGTSALVLYAQVANVGVGTYPTVTFIQRRESRSTGLTRDIRVIKDVEIPPNDGVILVDGRMVLEKTPLIIDRVYIQGTQSGVVTITDVSYCEPLGLATVTTMDAHGFSAGEQITLGGIAFTCSNNNSGITTTIFPDPQSSYIVETAPTADAFTTRVGSSNGITHFYNGAQHSYVRSDVNSVFANGNAVYFTPTSANYDSGTGDLELNIPGHGLFASATSHTPNWAFYTPSSGIMTVTTATAHGFDTDNVVKFDDHALAFKCEMDGNTTIKTYPRSGKDPAYGTELAITAKTATTITVDAGQTTNTTHNAVAGSGNETTTYDPNTGLMRVNIGSHSLKVGTSVKLGNNSFTFTCAKNSHGSNHTYPRSGDPARDTAVNIEAVTANTITLNVGPANDATAGAHTYVSGGTVVSGGNYTHTWAGGTSIKAVTTGGYTLGSGELDLEIGPHSLQNSDKILIALDSIGFTCTMDNRATEHFYPRITDPAAKVELSLTRQGPTRIRVNFGES